ncbi:hypothetical protein [Ochrobactrum sp. MC-1LL]|uniref:hypothetical protein n=1 Tax=Ochrobactrum sp. MC-1LL TaxID=2735351 RepID=UPI001438342F|nr:hypothetical protein [Ochrobactrum sp. MC-1LL]NKE77834.1 hypothetical protein [Ochrobactrum sp. MC-1LL]
MTASIIDIRPEREARQNLGGWTSFIHEYNVIDDDARPAIGESERQKDTERLQSSTTSATSMFMSEVDAKIAAAEARTDTKFAQMMGELTTMRAEINGKFETLSTRLDHVEGATKGMRSTVIGTGIGVVAVIIAVMAYGAQWFGLGVDTQSISDQAAKNVLIQAQPRLDNLEKQIGVILTAIEAKKKTETP